VVLDRERCILCDRCTRFAREVAGDPLIHFTHRGNTTQVLTFPDEPFSSYFSGNTVQICPVGALTAKPYRFKARPWDLQSSESTCTVCSVGCRITVESSRNVVLRYQGVDSDAVNWGWLCDKGRFSHESLEAESRLRGPVVRRGAELVPTSWGAALAAAAELVRHAVDQAGAQSVAVLGGARGTNEDAYAWAKLAKAVIGTDHVDCQLGDGLPADVVLGLPRATIDEACAATTLVLLGGDLKEELPVLFLRVRDAAERRRMRILEISATGSGLTPYAWRSLRHRPGEQGSLVRALLEGSHPDGPAIREQLAAGPVVVVAGRSSVAESVSFTLDALGALRAGVPGATFLPGLRRGNVHGALDAGLSPGLLPGRVTLEQVSDGLRRAWPSVPATRGLDAEGILRAAADGRIGCLVLLGADPLADFPDRDLAARALAGAAAVVAIDTTLTESASHADVVLAAAGFAEKAGTTTNLEGRVTELAQQVTPPGTARADWVIAVELAHHLGGDLGLDSPEQIRAELAAVSGLHAALTPEGMKEADDGVLLAGSSVPLPALERAALAPVDNYGIRLTVGRTLYDAGTVVATSASMAPLAPGARLRVSPTDAGRLGVTAGTAVKVTTSRTSRTITVEPHPSVPDGTAWLAANQPDVTASDLIDSSRPVTDATVETL
jgi:NADH-quinone oxidoreductase subunit G